ncbi:DUF2690 domain-containing protein, partial [Nesterenkonia muleiensis]|uniref:DUF2690 domain-containing protein n=1 Tax=Nesterenkonia muleiensis TaxID=2282648 RepID=UPI000E72A943
MTETDRIDQPGAEMGQAEGPAEDSVQEFANDLIELRAKAGNPILAALSKKAGVSKSVLSDAFRGQRLPTENTTYKLITALGDDPSPWLERRRALDPRAAGHVSSPGNSLTGETSQTTGTEEAAHDGLSAPKEKSRFTAPVLVAAGVGLLAALAGNAVWDTFLRSSISPTEPVAGDSETSPSEEYDDLRSAVESVLEDLHAEAAEEGREDPASGVDPMNTVCHEDSVIAASEERLDGSVQVQILWSNECSAAWGRITRWDEQSMGNSVRFIIYPQTEGPESENAQSRDAFDVQSVYTPMLIEDNV